MPRRDSTTTKAQSAADTRAALIEAGSQLLREQPVGTVLTQVKATEIARRAGRTIGAFYHHWPDQQTYQRDLVEYVLSPERISSTYAAAASALRDAEDDVLMEELVRRGARANFEALQDNPFLVLFMALWAKQGSDEHIQGQLRAHYQAVTARWTRIYEDFFEDQGWEPRPPFTIEMFAVTLTALAEGLTVRAAVDPDAVPLDLPSTQSAASRQLDGSLDQGSWDLFSIVVLSLLPSMTVPKLKRDADLWADHEDLRGLVRRLRETWESMVGMPTDQHERATEPDAAASGSTPRHGGS